MRHDTRNEPGLQEPAEDTSILRPLNGYISGLDGLRALALLSVFFGHAFTNIVSNAVGVDMFFALSGFLITRGLLDQLHDSRRIDFPVFYFRRALRLAPAFILMVVVLLVVAITMEYFSEQVLRAQAISSVIALTYMMNWSRAFHMGSNGWLGHTWSLSVEEQFYLAWPVVLATTYKIWGLRGSTIAAGVLAVGSTSLRLVLLHSGSDEGRIYNGFDTRADGLLIGCLLAMTRPSRLFFWAERLWIVPAAVILAIFFFAPWAAAFSLMSTVVSVATAWLIIPLWTTRNSVLAQALEFRPARYLGRISYGLYLWHWPIFMILWRLGYGFNALDTAIIAGGSTLLIASASFHFVEQPALRLKDRFKRSRSSFAQSQTLEQDAAPAR